LTIAHRKREKGKGKREKGLWDSARRNFKFWASSQGFENGPLLPMEISAVDENKN